MKAPDGTEIREPGPEDGVSLAVPGIRERILSLGATFVLLDYDGYGGKSTREEVVILNAKGRYLSLDAEPATYESFRQLCRELCEARYGQWYQASGGFGQFRWHLPMDTLTQFHTDRALRWIRNETRGLTPF